MNDRALFRPPPRGAARGRVTAVLAAVLLLATSGCTFEPAPSGEDASSARLRESSPIPAGWVAFAADWSASDISLVRPGEPTRVAFGSGEPAHRIFGSDDPGVSRMCPAFAPDGVHLAFGEANGDRETDWTGSALVVAELTAEGAVAAVERFALDDLAHAPCPIWSADGRWVAFGADTARERAARVVSDVWLVDTASGDIRVLRGLEATDLDWAPDGSELYVAGPAGIRVHTLRDGQTRTLDGTALAHNLTVSPDGHSLAVERRRFGAVQRFELVVMNVDGSDQRILVDDYTQMHSIGPVWSPDGSRIVFPALPDGHGRLGTGALLHRAARRDPRHGR